MKSDFVKPLLMWYNAAGRSLPWRQTRDPYAIWVSEIMLQQTRVETVKDYYIRFMRELPDVYALAECPDERLLKLWEGLGYYSRIRNMKKAAVLVTEEMKGQFPGDPAALRKLPGIGSYTAGAIASIAFRVPAAAVDGNVLRVFARMTALRENILLPAVKRRAEEELTALLSDMRYEGTGESGGLRTDGAGSSGNDRETDCFFDPGAFTQAMIELGALVCVPGTEPKCADCPVSGCCEAFRQGIAGELPVRIKNTARRVERRTVFLVRDGDAVAVTRRPERGLLAGMYEFPNVSGCLSAEEAASYVAQMGYEALRVRPLPHARHLFSHVEWQLAGYEIQIGQPDRTDTVWIFAEPDEIRSRYAIPSAFSAYTDRIVNCDQSTVHL